ncbi:uncharacterized protein LOC125809988 [Solanum verrucosum]|uniref:uncharacterized protein LOC125809988 n=1 Tax=Solanum verrucosum TaxID=315347 RepID=UPI0020D18FD3|nr:uncharacterized protein LOC125809988 [Solanum verrucosum]
MVEDTIEVFMDDFSMVGDWSDDFLMHLAEKGIEVDIANVEVIENLPPPISVKGVRNFLGHAAFGELKERLVSTPIIISPNWGQPFEMMCDASGVAFGVVFGQRLEKILHPTYSASKALNVAQKNYIVTEQELYAVVGIVAVRARFEVTDRKGTKNQAADHLSRLEEEAMLYLGNGAEINDAFPNE